MTGASRKGWAPVSRSKPAFGWLRGRRAWRRHWHSAREHAALAPSLTELRQWRTPNRSVPRDNELYQVFARSSGATKWVHYFDIYAQAFAPFRDRPIRFLEIGVRKGGSLRMWKEYFHPGSRIVGIDIDPACAVHDDPASRIFIRIGQQQDQGFLRSVIDELGPFDIVVDDGSHIASHILHSFNLLFASGMSERSIYLVEDLHTNYHPAFGNGAPRFLDMIKHLIDVMHAHYEDMHRYPATAFQDAGEPASFSVPAITTVLDQIQIFDSVVVLHRRAKRQTPVSQEAKAAARLLSAP